MTQLPEPVLALLACAAVAIVAGALWLVNRLWRGRRLPKWDPAVDLRSLPLIESRKRRDQVARAAVDEVLGPAGPGPFPPSSGLTRGGRAEAMPVRHTEDGDR